MQFCRWRHWFAISCICSTMQYFAVFKTFKYFLFSLFSGLQLVLLGNHRAQHRSLCKRTSYDGWESPIDFLFATIFLFWKRPHKYNWEYRNQHKPHYSEFSIRKRNISEQLVQIWHSSLFVKYIREFGSKEVLEINNWPLICVVLYDKNYCKVTGSPVLKTSLVSLFLCSQPRPEGKCTSYRGTQSKVYYIKGKFMAIIYRQEHAFIW